MLWKCGAYHTEVLYKIREDDVIKKTKEKKNGRKFLVCFKIVLSVPAYRGKVFKKAVGVFKESPSSSSYRFRLRQECLPKLYELENNQSEKKTKRLLKHFFNSKMLIVTEV